MRVLIAEDDATMRTGLTEILEGEGYAVAAAADGARALERWAAERADFVLLDIMMPERSGYDVCREIRRRDAEVPIVFLSAKSEEIDKVLGLELGADDFIMKPFGMRELVARVRAISRRCYQRAAPRASAAFTIGGVAVVPAELRATLPNGAIVELSLREVSLRRDVRGPPGRRPGSRHAVRRVLGRRQVPQQPHARPAHRQAPQEDRARPQGPGDHPHGPRRGLPLRRLARAVHARARGRRAAAGSSFILGRCDGP